MARPQLERDAQLHGRDVRVELALSGLPRVLGAAPELRQVFLGLVLNARDAMPAGGTVAIEGERRGDTVFVRVHDQGAGIPDDALPRIFDPFFTTKGDKGTGLGLAIARSVLLRLGGRIRARNAAGGGALFELEFPVSRLRAPDAEVPAPKRANLHVLVVDDDPDVLEAAQLVLENLGHRVDATPSGARRSRAPPRESATISCSAISACPI